MHNKTRNGPELVAPGGGFAAAAAALQGGADAVYVGLKNFSARAFAKNLDLEELRRLKTLALQLGKKIYVALNVIIRQEETEQLCGTLADLALFEIDGIIIQDMGVLSVAAKYFPSLRLHASTQLAVHNWGGIAFLRDRGVKRVILPRELSFAEIKSLRRQARDVELEVFIHGALCYSFSGLCLASGLLLNRSGNRGECAQVCRTWFNYKEEKGYYFSGNDLMLEEEILKLADLGIDAFKIEGRMKPPAYCAALAGAYKSILEKKNQSRVRHLFADARLVFSREPTRAYFDNPRGQGLVNKLYAGHTGLELGKVLRTGKRSFLVRLERDLEVRDGLMFFSNAGAVEILEAETFAVKKILKNGAQVFKAAKGESVWIEHTRVPPVGRSIYKISEQRLKVKDMTAGAYQPHKTALDMVLTLTGEGMEANVFLKQEPFSFSRALPVLAGNKSADLAGVLSKHLAQHGDSFFTLGKLEIRNQTPFAADRIFIQPSLLKKIKQELYERCLAEYRRYKQALYKRITADNLLILKGFAAKKAGKHSGHLPPRSRITWRNARAFPFVADWEKLDINNISRLDDVYYLALPPLRLGRDEAEYIKRLSDFFSRYKEYNFAIGLNNVFHLSLLKELSRFAHVRFFIDYGLYCANLLAMGFFVEHVPGLSGLYFWIEAGEEDYTRCKKDLQGIDIPLERIDQPLAFPLFSSRACFARHILHADCQECKKQGLYSLRQNKNHFVLAVENCISYLFKT